MKKTIVSFLATVSMLTNVVCGDLTSYATAFSTESEEQTDAAISSIATDSMVNDIAVFTEGEIMKIDDVIELSKKSNALTLYDLAKFKGVVAGSGIFILEYDLGNGYTFMVGSMTLERIDFARLRYSDNENYIDIRTDDVAAFLSSTQTTIPPLTDSNNTSPEYLRDFNLVTELKNEGCWINLNLESGAFSMSGSDTQSFSVIGTFERKDSDLYLYPENASAEFYVLHREEDHFVSQSDETGVQLKEGLVFNADNDYFWDILLDWTLPVNESNSTGHITEQYNAELPTESEVQNDVAIKSATTDSKNDDLTVINDTIIPDNDTASPTNADLKEYNLVTESKNDGCWINLDLSSGIFAMSGNDHQSFSIIGSFERKDNDLYLYPTNASTEYYVLHREDDHFVSRSAENGVQLKEGLVFYADNDAFWEILLDWIPPENASNNTGDTVKLKSNIASDDELSQWAIKDYQDKAGVTAASAEVTAISDAEYAIVLKDVDGNILDTYTINPETGIGTDSSNATVNLPQTGNNSTRNLLTAIGAVLMIAFGAVAVKFSGVLNRRKRNEK